jgi:hypothetical protein
MGLEAEVVEGGEETEVADVKLDETQDEDSGTSEEHAEEVVVTIGEEAPPPEDEEKAAPEWVKELRKNHRELVRENRELKEKLTTTTKTEPNPVVLGAKPKLEDFDYDADKFEEELTKWHDQKRAVEANKAKAAAEDQKLQTDWQARLDAYGTAKAALKVKDYDEAEATAQELFNVVQQGIVVKGAENPALVIYALGKNPKKAKELSAITDPVKFAFAIAKLETQLKVTNRKAVPPPEKIPNGSGRSTSGADSQLERLRADAEKTGDYTKVTAYKRQKRAAS